MQIFVILATKQKVRQIKKGETGLKSKARRNGGPELSDLMSEVKTLFR